MSDMQKLEEAFRLLGQLVKLNGRRRARSEAELRMRIHLPEDTNQARFAPMIGRKARRERVRELQKGLLDSQRRQKEGSLLPVLNRHSRRASYPFRPVIGYVGQARKLKESNKDACAAMKYSWLHRNDKKVVLPTVEKSFEETA